MSRTTWARNTSGLQAHAQQRKEHTRQRVDAAIALLRRENRPVTFTTVAREAGVTKQYLYTHEQVRGQVEALRDQHRAHMVRDRLLPPQGKTDASKDIVILAKERRIKELEDEVCTLKRELHGALQQLYARL